MNNTLFLMFTHADLVRWCCMSQNAFVILTKIPLYLALILTCEISYTVTIESRFCTADHKRAWAPFFWTVQGKSRMVSR